jgi:hypothetical protein
MSNLTPQQQQAMQAVVEATLDAVKAAGPMGCPGGVLYSGLMAFGCSFNQFTSLMGALQRTGKVRKQGELYFIAEPAVVAA